MWRRAAHDVRPFGVAARQLSVAAHGALIVDAVETEVGYSGDSGQSGCDEWISSGPDMA